MKKTLALVALTLLSVGAQAENAKRVDRTTIGPKSATVLPEAHKRAIRKQQIEDDRNMEAQQRLEAAEELQVSGKKPKLDADGQPISRKKER